MSNSQNQSPIRPKQSRPVNIVLLFIIVAILFFLYFRHVKFKKFFDLKPKQRIEQITS